MSHLNQLHVLVFIGCNILLAIVTIHQSHQCAALRNYTGQEIFIKLINVNLYSKNQSINSENILYIYKGCRCYAYAFYFTGHIHKQELMAHKYLVSCCNDNLGDISINKNYYFIDFLENTHILKNVARCIYVQKCSVWQQL